ncbi:MAG: FHA domain-containing protein [Deltaproteobacteria bacterium]|nr:FHA domain-containing protein [Deltaproteobacteria bacterium]
MTAGPRALRAVSLVVVKGHDAGVTARVGAGHCVMLGRSPLHGEQAGRRTGMLPAQSQQRLHIEDITAVERHLQTRNGGHTHATDASATFERDVDLVLADEAVSACHAMVCVDHAGASLHDLGSTNGSFVNGAAARSADLADGDLVRLGETRVSVRFGGTP